MSTVALIPTRLVSNTGSAITQGAGTAIVAADTNTIAYPQDGELLIVIDSDHANTAATVAATDYAIGEGLGSVTYAVGNGVSHLIVVGSSSRLKKSAGSISITWHTDSAGYIRCFYLPTIVA